MLIELWKLIFNFIEGTFEAVDVIAEAVDVVADVVVVGMANWKWSIWTLAGSVN